MPIRFSVKITPHGNTLTHVWVSVGLLTSSLCYVFTGPGQLERARALELALAPELATGRGLVCLLASATGAGSGHRTAKLWAGDELAFAAEVLSLDVETPARLAG